MGHWYSTDGTPTHTVNGKPTTLREARKLDLYPSVTSILNIESKPQLTTWLQKEVIYACEEAVLAGRDLSDHRYLLTKSKQKGEKAANEGTEIHNAIEEYILTGTTEERFMGMCCNVVEHINTEYGEITHTEQSFTNTVKGYGGCVDIVGITPEGQCFILDFKTKDFAEKDNVNRFMYDSHVMQLSAYNESVTTTPELPPKLINLFVSRNELEFGIIKSYEWDVQKAQRGLHMFDSLLEFWQLTKKFGPCYDDFLESVN